MNSAPRVSLPGGFSVSIWMNRDKALGSSACESAARVTVALRDSLCRLQHGRQQRNAQCERKQSPAGSRYCFGVLSPV